VADLGNLRKKEDASFLVPVMYELLSGKVIPLLIGGSDAAARAQFLAYQEAKALVNMVSVHEQLQLQPGNGYAELLQPRHALLFHFALIGYQTHQTPATLLDYLDQQHFEAIRLGRSRQSIEETEPTIRDADLLALHLAALKQSEAPAVHTPSPSGYFLEEACQLCRYAGMSDKLTSFGVYGFDHTADTTGQTAQVTAQMLWYFTDGYFNRKGDYPVSTNGLTEYIVEFRQTNYQLTFWKSTRSGRWWMQIPVESGKRKYQRHRLIPCSYQDYQSACREELPDRLMQAFKRFG
jgi:formiminoglutamase